MPQISRDYCSGTSLNRGGEELVIVGVCAYGELLHRIDVNNMTPWDLEISHHGIHIWHG